MIYKMELIDSVDDMIFPLLEVPIADKDITGIADNTTVDGNVFRDYLWLKKQWTQKWSIMCQDEYNRLRGFWTRQFGNAEVPFYRLFYGDNVYEDKTGYTVNGFVQIEDDAPLYSPLSLTHLYGNATQKTTAGKNLACIKTSATKTIGGVAFTIVDGVLNISSGTTAGYTNFYFDSFQVPNSGASSFWMEVSGYTPAPSDNCTYVLQESTDGGSTWTNTAQMSFASPNIQHPALDSSKLYRIRIYAPPSVVFNNAKVKFQLEYGSAKTDFEPYCGGVPSPNPDYPQTVNVVTGEQTVQIMGKNLFNKTQQTTTGWLNADGTINTGATTYCITDYITVHGGTVYTTSGMSSSGVNPSRCYYDSAKNFISGVKHNSAIPFANTAPDNAFYMRDCFLTADIDSIQIEAGQATTYEPYQAQSYEINLGKNLLDNTGTFQYGYIDNSGNFVSANNTVLFDQYISAVPSSPYTFSSSHQNVSMTMLYFDASKTFISRKLGVNTKNVTDTTPSNCAYIRVQANYDNTQMSQSVVDSMDLMLEAGSVATSYAPYKTPIELAKIGTHQDYIYKDGGKWYKHAEIGKVVLDGSEESGWSSINTHSGHHDTLNYTNDAIAPLPINSTFMPLSDNFTGCKLADTWAGNIAYGVSQWSGNGTNHYIQFSMPSGFVTDATAFKTWLSTHNTTVYYALATPTDTEITDADLIEQLNHIYSLYGGVNNLMLIPSGGAQGEINFKYRLNYEQETDIVPKTPVVLTLSDGGVINTCGCRENIQLIMRETTQGNSES